MSAEATIDHGGGCAWSPSVGADTALVLLPHGLPGFPGATRFRLEPVEGTADRFVRLRSMEVEGPCFLLALDAGASLLDADDLVAALGETGLCGEDVVVTFVVTLCEVAGTVQVFVNRRAPLLIDVRRRLGAQVVLSRTGYDIRHPLSRR